MDSDALIRKYTAAVREYEREAATRARYLEQQLAHQNTLLTQVTKVIEQHQRS